MYFAWVLHSWITEITMLFYWLLKYNEKFSQLGSALRFMSLVKLLRFSCGTLEKGSAIDKWSLGTATLA